MTATVNDCTQCVLDAQAFAALVGVRTRALPQECIATIESSSLGYEILTGLEREEQLLRALRGSESGDLRVSGPDRAADWERGWQENLSAFEASDGELSALVPQYNRHLVLRMHGDYIRVGRRDFEYAVYTALRQFLFRKWFGDVQRVVEFGCGTGTSLLLLGELFPQLQLCGLDWAEASMRILGRIARQTGRAIEGKRFDMFAPGDIELGPGTGVLTSAALEQVGERFEPLLERLLEGRPALCLHIEPLVELYDAESLFDDVARRYHHRRGYLRGFLPRLQQLERDGRIEILELRRIGFGSFFHEGYSVVAWRPVGRPRGR